MKTDPVAPSASVLRPGESVYTELGTWGRGETARIAEPFPVEIEIDALAG